MTTHTHDPIDLEAAQPELPPAPVSVLAVGTVNLLEEAADLPQPRYLSISEVGQQISLQFGNDPSSLRAITRWTLRFGGVVTSEPHDGERGPETLCRTEFDYFGVTVSAYAFIPAQTATPATPRSQETPS